MQHCNIKIILFLLGNFNSFLNNLFFEFINKCLKEILRCVPPSSHVCDFLFFSFKRKTLYRRCLKFFFYYVTFKNIFLKIDRESQHYQHTCYFICCWESNCDKKKNYGSYRRNYQKVETRILLASVHQGSEVSLCSMHLSNRNHSVY